MGMVAQLMQSAAAFDTAIEHAQYAQMVSGGLARAGVGEWGAGRGGSLR